MKKLIYTLVIFMSLLACKKTDPSSEGLPPSLPHDEDSQLIGQWKIDSVMMNDTMLLISGRLRAPVNEPLCDKLVFNFNHYTGYVYFDPVNGYGNVAKLYDNWYSINGVLTFDPYLASAVLKSYSYQIVSGQLIIQDGNLKYYYSH